MRWRFSWFTMLVWVGLTVIGWAQNPAKLAGSCRFDLTGDSATGSLDQGAVLMGAGSGTRMNWIPAADQPRSYTVSIAMIHYGWSEVAFRFLPASNGMVNVRLMGPWEWDAGSGSIYQQEVFWDQASAEGASFTNAGFEDLDPDGTPSGWGGFGTGSVISNGPPSPTAGTNMLVTWHDRVREQALAVTGGVPVTLSFQVRAKLPAGYQDMQRILSTNTPAHTASLQFMRGANLGNYLEAPPGEDWGQTYDTSDFAAIRNEGFDHVRIPAGWHSRAGPGPDFVISNFFLEQVDALVTNAVAHGLGAIVNIHHYDEMDANPAAESNKFFALWEQIATQYSNQPDRVALELMNEPHDNATTEAMNPIYAEAISRIRAIDPDRTILVGPGAYNSIGQLAALRLPVEESNVIVTVHNYEPFYFTHQGASWTLPDTATVGVQFPGPPDNPLTPAPGVGSWVTNWVESYNVLPEAVNPSGPGAFVPWLQTAKAWSETYGRPIHVGEFGCYERADLASRVRYYTEARSELDRLGLGWAMWDWKAGFKYWDESQGKPVPGMREAMFPSPRFVDGSESALTVQGARGKRFVMEHSHRPWTTDSWMALDTNDLTDLHWTYPLPTSLLEPVTFYRVVWAQ